METKVVQLEKRYNVRSPDFYHLYKAGELEQSREFIRWVGYYEAKVEREAQYQELSFEQPNLPFLIQEIEQNFLVPSS
ncbi:MAG: hypothetical protein R3E79_32085 [Caldilineaceae bacterium]